MGGAFLITRDIFENLIWRDIVKFRLFFFILGRAAYKDNMQFGNIELKKGQYLRSYRKLRDDLEYIENNSVKKYSLDTIGRKIDELVKEERLRTEVTKSGTLFTIINYEKYQSLDHYRVNNLVQTSYTHEPSEIKAYADSEKDSFVHTSYRLRTGGFVQASYTSEHDKMNEFEQSDMEASDSEKNEASDNNKYINKDIKEACIDAREDVPTTQPQSFDEDVPTNPSTLNKQLQSFGEDVPTTPPKLNSQLESEVLVIDNMFKQIGDYYTQLTGRFVNSIDAVEIQEIAEMTDDILTVKEAMDRAKDKYKSKFPGDKIRSFKYFAVVIKDTLALKEAMKNGISNSKKQPDRAFESIGERSDKTGIDERFIKKWS